MKTINMILTLLMEVKEDVMVQGGANQTEPPMIILNMEIMSRLLPLKCHLMMTTLLLFLIFPQ